LNALAHRPDGRATLDEIRRDAPAFAPSPIQTERLNHHPDIADMDIFTSGLVFRDNGWLHITDAGRSLLHSLESGSSLTDSPTSPGAASPLDTEAMTARGAPAPEYRDHSIIAPAPDLRPTRQDSDRKQPRQARFLAALNTWTTAVAGAWKGHSKENNSNPIPRRAAGRMGAAVSAFLSFFAFVACATAVIALVQTKTLNMDIARLNRELGSLSERLDTLERAERSRPATGQQEASQSNAAADQHKSGVDRHADATPLILSSNETQLIREYIKPAPSTGAPAPEIRVGDPVNGGTIPLPSPLIEKVPKLLGARFTTRNGSIVIVGRDSHRADAVLGPN